MEFEYLEVRPCIEIKGEVSSYLDEDEFNRERDRLSSVRLWRRLKFNTYWSLYGRYSEKTPDGKTQFLAMAIGDFASKEDAHEVMNAILAPMAKARDLIDDNVEIESDRGAVVTGPERASALLEDFINQCSNHERI